MSGILVLPIFRTLRYYRNYIKPTCSFNTDLIKNLTEETEGFFEQERYVNILIDEMKIDLGEKFRGIIEIHWFTKWRVEFCNI